MKGIKNRLIKNSLAALLTILIIIVSVFPTFAAAQPSSYSKSSNSGQRDVVCTTLSGTSAGSYYTGNYQFDVLSEQSSSTIQSSLKTLMTSTHKYISTYNDCHYKANITDCENGDGSVSLIYTAYSATMSQWNGWNREHVWPKSLGGNNTSGGGADLHHIRPSDADVNSSRGNKKYGYSNGGTAKYGSNPATGYLGGTYNSTYFEPRDEVKGDVARICLYVYVRWGSDWGATSITKVFQSVDVLLEWCELDPVDTWEMGRNEVVQNIQGNRNVFIDYPEYAWLIFDKAVPNDMVTPSGEAKGGVSTPPSSETPSQNPSEPPVEVSNGSLQNPLTTTKAVSAVSGLAQGETSSAPFYVKGTVTEIGETGSYYKNVYISDGTTKLLIYTINMGTGISGFEVGDTITAYGYIKNYMGTIEMATNNSVSPASYVVCVAVDNTETPTDTPTETKTEAPTQTPTETPTESSTETPITPPVDNPCGTLVDPLTTTQAVQYNSSLTTGESSDAPFYVKGKVIAIESKFNYYAGVSISDGVTELLIYSINMDDGIDGFEVGDTITAYGYIKNSNETLQMSTKNVDGTLTYVTCVEVSMGSSHGTLEKPLTTTQSTQAGNNLLAGESLEAPIYVKGKVTAIDTKLNYYAGVYISDGTTTLRIFSINMGDGIDGFEIGDTIIAYGYIRNNNGTIEMATKKVDGTPVYVTCIKVESDNASDEISSETNSEFNSETQTEAITETLTEAPTEAITETVTEPSENTSQNGNGSTDVNLNVGCGSAISISLVGLTTAIAAGFVLSKKKR